MPKTIEWVFAERRSIVYEIVAETVLDRLLGDGDERPTASKEQALRVGMTDG